MTVLAPDVALKAIIFLVLCIRIPSAFIGFRSRANPFVVSMIAQSYKKK